MTDPDDTNDERQLQQSAYRQAWDLPPADSDESDTGKRRTEARRAREGRERREHGPADHDGAVLFSEQRGAIGGNGRARPADEYDRQHELSYAVNGSDPEESPAATVVTGLPRRQHALHEGRDVKAPRDDGEGWFKTGDGRSSDAETQYIRHAHQSAMQAVDVPHKTQERVLTVLEGEDARAWSRLGGWDGCLVGVLAALGYGERASDIADTRQLDATVERLERHATERGLI